MDEPLLGASLWDELPLGESLVDKARRLREVAGKVVATRGALQDARRLRKRTEELHAALAAPAAAVSRWRACADAAVPNLQVPDDAGLSAGVAGVWQCLDAQEPQERLPDSDFDTIKHGLTALARRIDEAVADAWQPFARSRAASAGLGALRALPPATRQSLDPTVRAVQRAVASPPAGAEQVDAFFRSLAFLERAVDQARVRDLPAELKPVFDRLGGTGFPLRELTVEQLRLLQENGLADTLVVRWAG